MAIIKELQTELLKANESLSWAKLGEALETNRAQLHAFANGDKNLGLERADTAAEFLGMKLVKKKQGRVAQLIKSLAAVLVVNAVILAGCSENPLIDQNRQLLAEIDDLNAQLDDNARQTISRASELHLAKTLVKQHARQSGQLFEDDYRWSLCGAIICADETTVDLLFGEKILNVNRAGLIAEDQEEINKFLAWQAADDPEAFAQRERGRASLKRARIIAEKIKNERSQTPNN